MYSPARAPRYSRPCEDEYFGILNGFHYKSLDDFARIGTDLELERSYPRLFRQTEFWEGQGCRPRYSRGSDSIFFEGSEPQFLPSSVTAGLAIVQNDKILILVKEVDVTPDRRIRVEEGGIALGHGPGEAWHLRPTSEVLYYLLGFTKYPSDEVQNSSEIMKTREASFDSRDSYDSAAFGRKVKDLYEKLTGEYINKLTKQSIKKSNA
jgi:hypothetical protein